MDKLIQGTAADQTIRVMAAITTETVAEAVSRHQTSPTVSAAFGRVLTGTLLLASSFKDFDRLTVKIECNGAVKGIAAEANADGKVRGYVKNPVAELPPNGNGKFDVAGIISEGMFHVIRESGFDIGLYREPYHGSVPLVSGEIAEDFAYYPAKIRADSVRRDAWCLAAKLRTVCQSIRRFNNLDIAGRKRTSYYND